MSEPVILEFDDSTPTQRKFLVRGARDVREAIEVTEGFVNQADQRARAAPLIPSRPFVWRNPEPRGWLVTVKYERETLRVSKIKPTRLKANEARITVTVERRDEPTVSVSNVTSKWSLDIDVETYSITLTTSGGREMIREMR